MTFVPLLTSHLNLCSVTVINCGSSAQSIIAKRVTPACVYMQDLQAIELIITIVEDDTWTGCCSQLCSMNYNTRGSE